MQPSVVQVAPSPSTSTLDKSNGRSSEVDDVDGLRDVELGQPGLALVTLGPSDANSKKLKAQVSSRYFAERLEIVFRDVRFTVSVQEKGVKGTTKKEILKGLSGVIKPGRLTFVMGASGAGKTTFLNVLAGYSKGPEVGGSIKVNGKECVGDDMRKISGFVHQEDVVLDTMTVREALNFAAQLKLPSDMSSKQKEQRAMDVAELLNLQKSLDNVVGSATLKGISGGEKRRLSLGMEAVTNPSIMFLDEPTSGLDSATAYKVVKILAHMAHHYGRNIICTIHQPSSDIFHLADDLIVLADGQVLYHGEVKQMVPYFDSIGFPCPTYTNPADFLFRAVLHAGDDDSSFDFVNRSTIDTAKSKKSHAAEQSRVQDIIQSWAASPLAAEMARQVDNSSGELLTHGVSKSVVQGYAPFLTQFTLLAARAMKNSWRNQLIIKGKVASTVFLSIVVGLIYLRLGDDYTGVQDRQGSLFFLIVQGLFGSVMGMLTVFGAEKAVFQREYTSRMYGLFSYFSSRYVVELPSHIVMPFVSCLIVYWMVGYQNTPQKFWWFALVNILMDNCGAAIGMFVSCLFNDINMALSVMPMFLLPLMVFSGFFVNSDSIPPYFWWIQWISPMKYGFTALASNEFSGLQINCTPEQNCSPGYNGDVVLSNLGFDGKKGNIGLNCGILFALMWGFTFAAYVALWRAVRCMRT